MNFLRIIFIGITLVPGTVWLYCLSHQRELYYLFKEDPNKSIFSSGFWKLVEVLYQFSYPRFLSLFLFIMCISLFYPNINKREFKKSEILIIILCCIIFLINLSLGYLINSF